MQNYVFLLRHFILLLYMMYFINQILYIYYQKKSY